MSIEALVKEYSSLSDAEQAEFLALIGVETDEDDLSPEWEAEIDRRWQEVLDGTATLVSGEELSKKLTEKFGVGFKLP
jgi:hypothetical protein